MNFATLKGLTIPEGVVTQIADASGRVLWSAGPSGGNVVLEVVKKTSNTYAGETTYQSEEFILLDIYPKTNGTVSVTYGGVTKTITDTSGAAEPNAQQVVFGTFNGVVYDSSPESGRLTIEGDYDAFACGQYAQSSKYTSMVCSCVKSIKSLGTMTYIPDFAFGHDELLSANSPVLTDVIISENIKSIGIAAFGSCDQMKRIEILATNPPTLTIDDNGYYLPTEVAGKTIIFDIIVPKGCGNVYKTAEGWSTAADYIVEAS